MDSSSSSSTSRTPSSLTDDTLIEIFAHLPLNSIYRFKCLSKVWLSNLSNPNFMIKWFDINNKSLPWILYYSIRGCRITDVDADENPIKSKMAYPDLHSEFMSRNQHLFNFKFLMNQKPFQGAQWYLLGCSNGLVLCSDILLPLNTDVKYHVCNPLTQKWVSLPEPPRCHTGGFDVTGIFSEYSSTLATCYKVIRIPHFKEPSKTFNVDLFSSNLGVWESFEVSCNETVKSGWFYYDEFVILDGVLFWIEGGRRLLVYNLNQKNTRHQCSLINLPDAHNLLSRIGESEGRVCYTKIGCAGGTLSVWVLNEVNWQILHKNISLDDILAELRTWIGDQGASIQVLGFSPLDRNVVLFGWKNWVWGFNIQTRRFEDLCLDNRQVHDASGIFYPFVLKPMPTVLSPPSWLDT